MAGMFAPLPPLPGAGGDPYTKPIKGWESWQPQGPGPRQSGYGYGPPPNMQTGANWTNQYNYGAPKMYQPNAENRWTVFGRPDQYPWPSSDLGILEADPKAMMQAFLSAYGLGDRTTALTQFARDQGNHLQDMYTVQAAQGQPQTEQPLTFSDWMQNNAAQVLDKMFRDATPNQQGRNPAQFAGRVRAVGGGQTGF